MKPSENQGVLSFEANGIEYAPLDLPVGNDRVVVYGAAGKT